MADESSSEHTTADDVITMATNTESEPMGETDDEPERMRAALAGDVTVERVWKHAKHTCEVRSTPQGHFCGYVRLRVAGFTLSALRACVDVHNQLTYGIDSLGRIGFDCALPDDVCLNEANELWGQARERADRLDQPTQLALGELSGQIWTVDDVVEETEKLAEQIDAVETLFLAFCAHHHELVEAVDEPAETDTAGELHPTRADSDDEPDPESDAEQPSDTEQEKEKEPERIDETETDSDSDE